MVASWETKNELQGILLIGLGLVIVKIHMNDSYSMLIHLEGDFLPRFTIISLFVIGFFRIMNSDLSGASCSCEACDPSEGIVKTMFRYSFYILPILFALSVE